MDFRQGSKASLLLQFATAHGITFEDAARWTFSPPVALAGDDPSGKNSKVKLTALRPHTANTGFKSFKYNRIQLQYLGINLPTSVPAKLPPEVTTTHGAFGYLLKNIGVKFDASDLEDHPVIDNGDGTRTIKLVALANSLLWLGSYDLITSDLPHISMAIDPPTFDWS